MSPPFFNQAVGVWSSYAKHILTEARSNAKIGEWSTEGLHQTLMEQWGDDFQRAQVVTGGDRYTSWLEYFIRFNFGYGTVSAWAAAVVRKPWLFLGPGSNTRWGLDPSQFGEYCELLDGSTFIHEPDIDRDGNIILRDDINFARRVWDVRANRVIPACWVPQAMLEPVSHAWAPPELLEYIWSPINYLQWNIPVPRGGTLEVVRQELLRFQVEYSWLDVLCLRQVIVAPLQLDDIPPGIVTSTSAEDIKAKSTSEASRMKEWATDVPLIGGICKAVRQELLRLQVEYSCSKFLHPRQAIVVPSTSTEDLKTKSEARRAKEWPTDVPLIGGIYKYGRGRVIVFLNGLGKSFNNNAESQDLTNQRHWLRRAWTLQETVGEERMVIAGLGEDAMDPLSLQAVENAASSEVISALRNCISHKFGSEILKDISQMAPRYATNPLDKVAGLFFVLFGHLLLKNRGAVRIPKYDVSKTEEEAWGHLLHSGLNVQGLDGYSLTGDIASQLVGSFPHDPSSQHWFPTWKTVLNWPNLEAPNSHSTSYDIYDMPPKYDLSIPVISGRLYKKFEIRRVGKDPNSHIYSLGGNRNAFNLCRLADGSPTSTIQLTPVGKAKVNVDETSSHSLHDSLGTKWVLLIGPLKVQRVLNASALTTGASLYEYRSEFCTDTARFLVCQNITSLRPHQGPYQRTYLKVLNCFQCIADPSNQLELRWNINPSSKLQRSTSNSFQTQEAAAAEAKGLLLTIERDVRLEGRDISPSDRIYLE